MPFLITARNFIRFKTYSHIRPFWNEFRITHFIHEPEIGS